MNRPAGAPVRVLFVAPHPFRSDDLVSAGSERIAVGPVVRRPRDVGVAVEEWDPDVIVVSTEYPEQGGIGVIGEARLLAPDAEVLALTADPADHSHVALAARAGASGFVDVGASSEEFAEAVETVDAGEEWFPAEATRGVLVDVADDLDTTASERRSRLIGITVGLVPLAGAIAALLSLLYRRYLGQIGVRPVDIAIDPASRVVDAVSAIFFMLGFFGPLLFVGTWIDLLSETAVGRGPLRWLLERRRLASAVLAVLLLGGASLLAVGFDLVLIVFVGSAVALALLARALDFTDDLPRALRLDRLGQRKAFAAGVAVLGLFIGLLSVETFLVGPRFDTDGVEGFFMSETVGFNATPMLVQEVDSGQERQLLYLGGNADLYVLVDPCEDDEVLYVSVGATRLKVIDEIDCSLPSG